MNSRLTALPRLFAVRLHRTYDAYLRHEGDLLAASVAYYAALSFFPLLLVLISGLGVFLGWTDAGRNAEQSVLSVVAEYASPALKGDVQKMLKQVQTNAVLGGPIGVVTLLFTSLGLFIQIERAFRRIFEVPDPSAGGIWNAVLDVIFSRLKAFGMLFCLGTLVVVVFVIGMVLTAIKTYAVARVPGTDSSLSLLQLSIGLSLNAAVFTTLFRVLPLVRVPWSAALQGGILTAVVWEIGRMILAGFLIGGQYGAYGLVGSFIAALLWIYYAATVIFLGAEFVRVVANERAAPSS